VPQVASGAERFNGMDGSHPAAERGKPEIELSIIVPVYNEEARVGAAAQALIDCYFPFETELLVVDDGSTDGTPAILEQVQWRENTRLIRHERNRGKGAAVRTGLAQARGTFTAIFDADLEYDPADLETLMVPLRRGDANAAFGVRAFDGHSSHSFLFVLGNKLVTLAANALFNVYIRDLMTCHKVIRTELFRELSLRANGFTIEPEIAARLVQRGERIFELPVTYTARSSADGKKLTWRDGVRVLGKLVQCRLSGGRKIPVAPAPAQSATVLELDDKPPSRPPTLSV
jgi:glycosyltransferase involved in cell wall biosynthesis